MNAFQATIETQLLAGGHLSPQQLAQAKGLQDRIGCSLEKALWSLNIMTQAEVLQVLSAVTDRPSLTHWIATSGHRVDFTLAHAVDPAYLSQVGCFPCAWQDSTTVVVAVTEPANPAVTQAIHKVWPQVKLAEVLARENQILSLIIEANLERELLTHGKLRRAQWQEAQAIRQQTEASLGTILNSLGYLRSTDVIVHVV